MRQSQSLRVFSSPSRASGTALMQSGTALFLILICLTLCSCVPKNKTSSRLKVIASMPVVYDWTRNLMDESTNTKFFLNLIIKNGLNYHNQTPGTTEENLINTANIIRYPILALLAILVISSVLVLGIIMSSISRKGGEKGKETPDRFIDKIPLDLLILIIGTIIGFVATLIVLTDVAR